MSLFRYRIDQFSILQKKEEKRKKSKIVWIIQKANSEKFFISKILMDRLINLSHVSFNIIFCLKLLLHFSIYSIKFENLFVFSILQSNKSKLYKVLLYIIKTNKHRFHQGII